MLNEESARVLRDLTGGTVGARTIEETFELSARTVAACALETPFLLFYQVDPGAKRARLLGCAGLAATQPPPSFVLLDCTSFPGPVYVDSDGWQEIHSRPWIGAGAGRAKRLDTEALERHVAELTVACELHRRLSGVVALEPLLEQILAEAQARENADMSLIWLCDPDQRRIDIAASSGFDAAALEILRAMPARSRPCSASFEQRRRIVVEDVEADPRHAAYAEAARLAGFRAVHSTPLVTAGGNLLGVLSTHFRVPHRPCEWAIRTADLCASHAADFIQNALLQRQLRESNRRKDEFLATLAHELRNPLASLSNALQMLNGSAGRAEPAHAMMERQIGHMARLVDDLLELSRITRGSLELRKERVPLASIVRNALETSRARIEQGRHRLEVSLPDEPLELSVDPVRIAQVLANLLDNAAKYTTEGGQIWLDAHVHPEEVSIRVRDSGVGIRPETLPQIFDMFTQGEGAVPHEGLGIGLGLVRNIVQLHGGRVEARSGGPGHGSEFTVRLPLRPDDAPSDGAKAASGPRDAVRVLIVDDNRDAADSLGELLALRGADVRVTYGGAAAVQAAHAYRPAVILLDLGMPGMDGYDVARQLRQDERFAATVLVALTGHGQEEDLRRSRAAGFDHHMVKPVDLPALLALLEPA